MGHQLLRDTDYMSMWHGLEVRVPFLDREFVDLCHEIAPELKYGRGRGKYLLIKAFEDVLPEKIWKRRKSGFAFPFKDWFRAIDLFKDFKFPANAVEDGLRVGDLVFGHGQDHRQGQDPGLGEGLPLGRRHGPRAGAAQCGRPESARLPVRRLQRIGGRRDGGGGAEDLRPLRHRRCRQL